MLNQAGGINPQKLEAEISMARKKIKKEAITGKRRLKSAIIESLAHDGRGVAHVDGKVIFY